MIKAMSVKPFIEAKELRNAVAEYADGQGCVRVNISSAARKKVNTLAAANFKAVHGGNLEKHVGIAVVANGKPAQVIQGVQPLTENTLWWCLGNTTQTKEQALGEAQTSAKRIARKTSSLHRATGKRLRRLPAAHVER
jgi:hypothetical protein